MTQQTKQKPVHDITEKIVLDFIKEHEGSMEKDLIEYLQADASLERVLQLKAIVESLKTNGHIVRESHDEGLAVRYCWRLNSQQHAA